LKNTICNNFLLAKPTEIVLEHQAYGKTAVFHYVPVTDVLNVMLAKHDILQHIMSMAKPNLPSSHLLMARLLHTM